MKVIVAEKCGFCHGVRNAISLAKDVLKDEAEVYSLGPIIHNKEVVNSLARAGLKTVEKISQINSSATVLIRSHGAAPAQINRLEEKGLTIADATCILVKRVQKIAKQLENDGYRVVIIGNENHPEVHAVAGCVRDVVVIADEKDVHKLAKRGKLGIICQTTQSPEYFGKMVAAICEGGFTEIRVINTLCKEAIMRQESAVQLCKKVDIMFVLGSLDSANTRKLAELCKKYNKLTFHLQNWYEFDKSILSGKILAGVTAGASTPQWIVSEFVEELEKFATCAVGQRN